MRRLPARGLASAVRNVAVVCRATVDWLGVGSSDVVDFASGYWPARSTVSVVDTNADPVGWLALKLVGDGPDQSVDALPTLWESNLNHALGSSPGLAVEVVGNLLGEVMADVTELLGWRLVDCVWVYAVGAGTGVVVESTEGRSDSGVERVCFLDCWLGVDWAGRWHLHRE